MAAASSRCTPIWTGSRSTTGTAVTAGQAIGTVGDTGLATGPHLHFQVSRDGRLQDPQQWLAGLDANASARALRMRKEQFGY